MRIVVEDGRTCSYFLFLDFTDRHISYVPRPGNLWRRESWPLMVLGKMISPLEPNKVQYECQLALSPGAISDGSKTAVIYINSSQEARLATTLSN